MNQQETLILRAAHICEAAEIASMSRQQVEYGLNWRWTPARVKRSIKDPETMVLISSKGGVMQGFAIMKFADETAHLMLFAVQPKMRRSGVGTAMLEWLEKSCVTAGIQLVRLEVRVSNKPARKFYEQMGYQLIGKLAAYYDKTETAVVMGKSFGEMVHG